MSGILFVVATPIGNLEDVTLRALRILREVSVIAAEDTRRTAKLLQHYSISTPTTSLHAHNEHARTPQLIERLARGESVALVSDAGTPGISDPGGRLVGAAHAAGIPVQPVPGPSAVSALVSAAGLPDTGYLFAGFPPARAGERSRWLRSLVEQPWPIVLYEAPHRIRGLLADLRTHFGNRTVGIGRELTKVHEKLAVRPIATWTEDPPPEQGEFAVVIFPASDAEVSGSTDQELADAFHEVIAAGSQTRREAIRAVARRFHVSARRVFAAVEALRGSGE